MLLDVALFAGGTCSRAVKRRFTKLFSYASCSLSGARYPRYKCYFANGGKGYPIYRSRSGRSRSGPGFAEYKYYGSCCSGATSREYDLGYPGYNNYFS